MSTHKEPQTDAELEQMLAQLAPEDRDALLEEHRQLEKDLLRLADPQPPADFVQQVMQRVASAPAPAMAPKDIALAALITVGAFAAGMAAFLSHGVGLDGLGLSFAGAFVTLRELFIGMGSALEVLWRTAAVPVAMGLTAMLVSSVMALKKLGSEGKVA